VTHFFEDVTGYFRPCDLFYWRRSPLSEVPFLKGKLFFISVPVYFLPRGDLLFAFAEHAPGFEAGPSVLKAPSQTKLFPFDLFP